MLIEVTAGAAAFLLAACADPRLAGVNRARTHVLAAALAAVLAAGCGGGAPRARSADDLADEISELRAQRRRDQTRMREMEERMAEEAAHRAALADRPELPVEHLEPAPAQGEVEVPPEVNGAGGPQVGEVVGVEADGTEIVYTGEAASDDSVAAPTALLREDEPAPPRRRAAAPPPPVALPADAGAATESLGTTRRVPRVAEALGAAPPVHARRSVPPRPRRRRAEAAPVSAPVIARYQRLVATLRAGHHAEAIAGLRAFLARYPKSDYADNAQYWLGEAYYDQKQFARARAEFGRVIQRFPDGNKVPDAMLKQAFCDLNLGHLETARGILERLVARYPDSRPADLARQKLDKGPR